MGVLVTEEVLREEYMLDGFVFVVYAIKYVVGQIDLTTVI